MRRHLTLLVLLAAAIGVILYWAWIGLPQSVPDARGRIYGVAYTPYQPGQQPSGHDEPTPQQIASDIQIFREAGIRAIRTYSAIGPHAEAVRAAQRLGMEITLGIWLSGNRDQNKREIEAAISLARENPNVVRILAGNEAILRRDLTVDEIRATMRDLRNRTGLPVSTAEPWIIWLQNPELSIDADHVVVHILPFWELVPNRAAVSMVLDAVRQIKARFPHHPIVVGETGWPSWGRPTKAGRPSLVTQAEVVRTVLPLLEGVGIDAFVMEAIDQPWKSRIEGAVGAYWGIWDSQRRAKFAFSGPVSDLPQWPCYAAASSILILSSFWLIRRSGLRDSGQIIYAFWVGISVLMAGEMVRDLSSQYWDYESKIAWIAALAGLTMLAIIIWADVREVAHALGRQLTRVHPYSTPPFLPPVSIHLPCHAEPPRVVCETLNSLARLDYPDYEVLVIDNNTKDPALWIPVQEYCTALNAQLGKNIFRFYHDEGVVGFKAGALNLALKRTRHDAQIIAVVDADYVVSPDWLISTVPIMMADPKIALIQAPQDHRDGEALNGIFKQAIRWEYEAFFRIGMLLRNEDDAIVQHGTMCLIRKLALEKAGGWATDSICEDTELGLRLSAAGWTSYYIPKSFGRGLSPDNFPDYAAQRHRWAYGGIRILLKHWRIFRGPSCLSPAQKVAWIAGWIPWLGNGLGVVASWGALVWTGCALLFPATCQVPSWAVSAPILLFAAWKVISSYWLYLVKVGATPQNGALAVWASLSLAPTIGRAVLYGFLSSNMPFLRTPKGGQKVQFFHTMRFVMGDCFMAIFLPVFGVFCVLLRGSYDSFVWLWGGVCIVFSIPYMAAVAMAILSASQPKTLFVFSCPVYGDRVGVTIYSR